MESPAVKRKKFGESQSTLICPILPVEESPEQQAHSYRLQQISLLKRQLEDEREKLASLYKKYHCGINAIDGVDTALVSASVGMGIGDVGLLCTIIAALDVLALECGSLACRLLGIAGRFISHRLSVKAKKHDEIRIPAKSKINTITDYVSTAITDGKISDQEFQLIAYSVKLKSIMQ